MLVLSRKVRERVLIGANIQVTVLAARGNQIRLGLSAPPEVLICREELILCDRGDCPSPDGPPRTRKPAGVSC